MRKKVKLLLLFLVIVFALDLGITIWQHYVENVAIFIKWRK